MATWPLRWLLAAGPVWAFSHFHTARICTNLQAPPTEKRRSADGHPIGFQAVDADEVAFLARLAHGKRPVTQTGSG